MFLMNLNRMKRLFLLGFMSWAKDPLNVQLEKYVTLFLYSRVNVKFPYYIFFKHVYCIGRWSILCRASF